MANKKTNKKIVSTKEIRLNKDLVGFLAGVIEEKIGSPGNVERIQEMYFEKTGLRFSNIARVISRSNREGVSEIKKNLIAELGLVESEVLVLELMLKDLAKGNLSRKYISVQV